MSGISGSAFVLTCLFVLASLARAQNGTQLTTDPDEVRALNAIFGRWNIKANTEQWNTTGDPCSGAAIDNTTKFDNVRFNPFIKCDCSFSNRSLCHITQLKVYAKDVSGPIPDEIWTLTFLINLDLRQNFLTGSLSPSIGNLTQMQYMSFGINALSGEVPKELGLLTKLSILSFSSNNFSGPLPPELGELSNLEQLYINSAGVSGEIPPTFANFRNLKTLWASDNQFTGSIPSFIGNWSQLTSLRFQGNSFRGPIPLKFSNLTSLQELRLSDISNMTTSSLDFIKDMKSLITLELRNNDMSASIPSNIGELQSLQLLDLSFNKLHGQIPESLFNLSSLFSVFLGNNSLNGTIPQQKSSSLRTIDVSYNNLVGDIPSWANTTNLQLNLVSNNFTLGSSTNQGIFSRLKCLQKNFPCNRGAPIYAGFGVNSGGPQITSSENIVYGADNEELGPASHSVFSSDRWGVSNVGQFVSNSNVTYKHFTSSQFANSLDPELFQTTRVSASSLRYYGLGLENGNYTVNLQFAEIDIESGRTWKSIGRRIFDVYVQGRLVLKDFNIKKEAGGSSFRVVLRPFEGVVVSENYLEVHLFWAGKGTCCIPAQGTYGPSISAFSATPEFIPTVSNKAPSTGRNKSGLIAGIVILAVFVLAGLFAIFIIVRKRRKAQMYYDEEFLGMDVKPFSFSYLELRAATNDFDSANKLGEGGFGPVFKGTLEDGRVIAVKQLSLASHQGKSQFVTEIATISAVQHRNLVKLYGCCLEGDKRLLVYEYLENSSLDQALFGNNKLRLDWPTRFEILLGIAKGLTYLHEESRLRIIHRDVKSSNILLDLNLVPKISDFGLAKLYDDKKTHMSTRVAGTIGYLAPEYAMRGYLTEKTDIFAFGVVVLEIISGRPNSDSTLDEEKIYLLEWAWNLREQGRELEIVDSELFEFDKDEVKRIIGVALLCTQTSPNARPSMSRVVAMISGDADVSTEIPRPGYLTDLNYSETTIFVTALATNGTESSFYDSTASMSIVAEAPGEPAQPFLRDTITNGM